MENQLVVLERLIGNLNAGIVGRDQSLKGTFLQREFKRIKSELEKLPYQNLEDTIATCEFHLGAACKLADVVIRLKVSLKMKKDLTDDEFYRLMKCDTFLKEFNTLINFCKELIQRKKDLNQEMGAL
ncbi:hypothetical protein D3C85_1185050 [compost metagenome]